MYYRRVVPVNYVPSQRKPITLYLFRFINCHPIICYVFTAPYHELQIYHISYHFYVLNIFWNQGHFNVTEEMGIPWNIFKYCKSFAVYIYILILPERAFIESITKMHLSKSGQMKIKQMLRNTKYNSKVTRVGVWTLRIWRQQQKTTNQRCIIKFWWVVLEYLKII